MRSLAELRGGRLLVWARRAYAVVLAGAFGYVLATSWGDLGALVRGARPALLAAALVAGYGQLVLTSLLWASALAAFGQPVGWAASLDATLGSTPARYLPGSVWYALGRATRLRRLGVGRGSLALAAGLEMLLVPVVGFALGGVLLAATARRGPAVTPGLVVAAVALAAAGSPPVVNAAGRRLAAWRGVEHRPLSWGRHLRLVGWTVAFWVWSGSVFTLYLAAFPHASGAGLLAVAGGYMVAWGVGWLALFAPQGVGVFEATLVAILGGGGGFALVVAGYRALIAVRDLLGFLAVQVARRRGGSRRPERTTSTTV